jgi:fermentation-respiration switch protein FrsA (DUF1100 family)
MRTTVVAVLAFALLAYAALCALAWLSQRSMIYFPLPESQAEGATALRIPSAGETLKVWAAGTGDPAADALIYFGGNADDVAAHLPAFRAAFPGRALYLPNYRGYAGSTGTPSEPALAADAVAVYDAVRARHPSAGIAVIGRSLGSGVAMRLAAERQVQRLVLVTPFDSLVEVARGHFPWLPVRQLLRDRYDSAALAASGAVQAPTLVVIATDDEVVPAARGEALVRAFGSRSPEVLRLPGATHNTVDLFPDYLDGIARFLASR